MSQEVNTVNVYSIDEEKLRYRLIIAVGAAGVHDYLGDITLNVPPPTSLTNSEKYRQCRMKCDSFCAYTAAAINNTTWSDGAAVKEPAIELQLSCPTSQTVANFVNLGDHAGQGGVTQMAGFRQILPGQVVNNPVASFAPANNGYSWMSISGRAENPILCANPFGQQITIRLIDPITRDNIWLTDNGTLGVDNGHYIFQFDVELVANN
tara:strand:- start:3200 stop:3823 length:624 start_codon:yes stop_codon:yes gene_type:complete